MMPGSTELIIIFAGLILLFGASKLPKLGGAIGQSIRNFKKGIASDGEQKDSLNERKSEESSNA